MKLILQKENTAEVRDVAHHAIINNVDHVRCDIDDLARVNCFDYMPFGSVEFVQRFFNLNYIKHPEFDCYAPVIHDDLGRKIEKLFAYDLLKIKWLINPVFLKPIETKRFNGFIFSGFDDNGQYDHHDLEQIEKLKKYIACERIYGCGPVNFVAEWRLYITNGELKACCRYDPNDEEYPLCMDFVSNIVSKFTGSTIAVDIGLLDSGRMCVVELNDAWAIGKYKGINNADYFEFLVARWGSLVGNTGQSASKGTTNKQ